MLFGVYVSGFMQEEGMWKETGPFSVSNVHNEQLLTVKLPGAENVPKDLGIKHLIVRASVYADTCPTCSCVLPVFVSLPVCLSMCVYLVWQLYNW